MILTQTLAIFADAYRELNAKKLFWFVLGISFLVVAAFGAVGINDKGLTIFWWQIEEPLFSTKFIAADVFYKMIFTNLGVKFWLAWIATILALVSTAGIIPDFIASGSIELSLSKPIRRVRLLLTKYAAGLLFATMQVTVFTLAAFLVIGLRGKTWEPGLFWAIPIMVLFFSYLFCVCCLLGLLTRSTIASLLLTLLIWFGVFGIHATEQVALSMRIANQLKIETLNKHIDELERQRDKGMLGAAKDQADGPAPAGATEEPPALVRRRGQLADAETNKRRIGWFYGISHSIKTLMPKTSETIGLLERTLISEAELRQMQDDDSSPPIAWGADDVRISTAELGKRIDAEIRSRSVAWVIGTSLAFEAVVLGAAVLIFARRDF